MAAVRGSGALSHVPTSRRAATHHPAHTAPRLQLAAQSVAARPHLSSTSSSTRPPWRSTCTSATGGSPGGGSDGGNAQQPDIDQLAAFLTQQAAAMRASLDEADVLPLTGGDGAEDGVARQPGGSSTNSFDNGSDDAAAVAAALASADAAVPPGGSAPLLNTLDALEDFPDERGFISQDFTLMKLLGKLGMQDVAAATSPSSSRGPSPVASMDSSSSSSSSSADEGPTPNILVYAARYNSGLPYQGPVTVQLREYLPGSRRVAINELVLQQRLCGALPAEKWQAAVADPAPACPVVRLLGYLAAPPSDEAYELTGVGDDTIWMVYKFEGLRPMSLMLQQMDLPEEPSGSLTNFFLSKEAAVAAALAARRSLLVAMARGLLGAISYCHQRGVAHCGIGAGCVMVNTWADKDVSRLLVRLDSFGFAKLYPQPLEMLPGDSGLQQLATFPDSSGSSNGSGTLALEDTDASLQRQQDLQAAALLLAEVFLVGSAPAGAEVPDAASLKRLLFQVFHEDVGQFKEYCLQDLDTMAGFVEFMSAHDGAGWELLETLMAGRTPAGELLRKSRLFNSVTSGGGGVESSSSQQQRSA